MSAITDPHDGLLSLQAALNEGLVSPQLSATYPDLSIIFDTPEGNWRLTYAFIKDGVVEASVVFVISDPIEGTNCFGIGYAVAETLRRNGLARDIVEKSINELQRGLKNKLPKFYLEAIIGAENIASQKVAEKFISSKPNSIVEQSSGLPAFQYQRLISISNL